MQTTDMKFFNVMSLDDCKKIVEGRLKKRALEKTNKNTADAVNFVLAEDVKSPDYFPPYTRSTVDGFAIRAEDAYCSSTSIPAFLKIKGKILMGEMPAISLEKGEAIQIATGGVLPKGANAVVMVENVEELGGEKSDIVLYDDDPTKFIAAALAPADVLKVEIEDADKHICHVTVPDHQLSLAIGNKGQNARLAAHLTGWKIDIKPESGFYEG